MLDMRNLEAPFTITARPGVGGTMRVDISTSPNVIQNIPGLPAAAWTTWAKGTVSAIDVDMLNGPVSALRFVATTADGTVEVVK